MIKGLDHQVQSFLGTAYRFSGDGKIKWGLLRMSRRVMIGLFGGEAFLLSTNDQSSLSMYDKKFMMIS